MIWENINLFRNLFFLAFLSLFSHFFSIFFSSTSFSSLYTSSSFFTTSFSISTHSYCFILHHFFGSIFFFLSFSLPANHFSSAHQLSSSLFPLSSALSWPKYDYEYMKSERCATWLQELDTGWPYIPPRRSQPSILNGQQADINSRQRGHKIILSRVWNPEVMEYSPTPRKEVSAMPTNPTRTSVLIFL